MKKDARVAETVDMTGFQNGGGGNLTASRNISKFAFTMAGGGQAAPIFGWMARRVAFTMAEILLSLTINAVVAAITLPSLMGNINERTWNTQRKALHARMSQAIAMMPQLNGYGTYETDSDGNVTDTAAEAFVTEGLSKVLKINNIYDADNLADCGIVSTFTTQTNSTKTWASIPRLDDINPYFTKVWVDPVDEYVSASNPQADINTQVAAFETQNGESILTFYNPYCVEPSANLEQGYVFPYMCANFVYDLNGVKGPNTVGKDIGFISALYPTDPSVVAPNNVIDLNTGGIDYVDIVAMCSDKSPQMRVPNFEELASIVYNRELLSSSNYSVHFSSSTFMRPEIGVMLRAVYDKGDYGIARKTLTMFDGYCIER